MMFPADKFRKIRLLTPSDELISIRELLNISLVGYE